MTTETLDMLTETLYTELRRNYLNKDICVVLVGAGAALPGLLLEVRKEFIIMDTRWSKRQIINLSQIQSFYIWDKH